jgi:hypothetical protein
LQTDFAVGETDLFGHAILYDDLFELAHDVQCRQLDRLAHVKC